MQGLLACLLALVAGCSFSAPELPSSDAAPGPGSGSDAQPVARCKTAYQNEADDGHRYHLFENAMTWEQAKAICEFDGAYLLKLDTTIEDAGAELLIDEQIEIWIGLNDTDQNGAYVWLDGTPPSFTRWSSSPPGATSPDCVVKNTLINDGRWYTRDCTTALPAVCECDP